MEKISILDLVACICDVIDLTSSVIKDHHNKTFWGAYHLADAMEISTDEKRDIILAAAIHDIGALSLNDRLSAVTMDFEDSNYHAEKGFRLLNVYEPFRNIAQIIRYHHTPWDSGRSRTREGDPIPLGSQVVLLADRISILLKPGIDMLSQASSVAEYIADQENTIYRPDLIAAFRKVSGRDSFWLDIISQSFGDFLNDTVNGYDLYLSDVSIEPVLDIFSNIIDYRSPFTATHSKCVAVVAGELSRMMGFPDDDVQTMKAAGLLHDIGKLVVPSEILEKKGPLDVNERSVIRSHTYYTNKVLARLSGDGHIREWASYHHENLDGSGYPFRLSADALSIGSRIMKVADIFTALMEDRPYRIGVGTDSTKGVLHAMVDSHKLDPTVVKVLCDNMDILSGIWHQAYESELSRYEQFREGLKEEEPAR